MSQWCDLWCSAVCPWGFFRASTASVICSLQWPSPNPALLPCVTQHLTDLNSGDMQLPTNTVYSSPVPDIMSSVASVFCLFLILVLWKLFGISLLRWLENTFSSLEIMLRLCCDSTDVLQFQQLSLLEFTSFCIYMPVPQPHTIFALACLDPVPPGWHSPSLTSWQVTFLLCFDFTF